MIEQTTGVKIVCDNCGEVQKGKAGTPNLYNGEAEALANLDDFIVDYHSAFIPPKPGSKYDIYCSECSFS